MRFTSARDPREDAHGRDSLRVNFFWELSQLASQRLNCTYYLLRSSGKIISFLGNLRYLKNQRSCTMGKDPKERDIRHVNEK